MNQATSENLYYLIYLQGQGDTQVKVIDLESWLWLINPDIYYPPPASVKARAQQKFERDKQKHPTYFSAEDEPEPPNVTIGSWANDRALWIPGLFVDGVELSDYTDVEEAADDIATWKKKLGIDKFTQIFEGYIY